MSTLLCSPESPVALMPPTLADPLPAYSLPRSSLELEFRLRWKPPDCGKESKRHACHAVNNRPQPSAMEHLPPPGTAFRLSVLRSSLAYIAQANSPRLLNVEVIWRARCKPPNATGTIQRQSAIVISARISTSAIHSLVYGVALTQPVPPFAHSAQVNTARRRDDELVWQLRKPADVSDVMTGRWLLDEVVNKREEGRRRGRSLVQRSESPPSWPTSPSFARSPSRDNRLPVYCTSREAPVILRVNGTGRC